MEQRQTNKKKRASAEILKGSIQAEGKGSQVEDLNGKQVDKSQQKSYKATEIIAIISYTLKIEL